jgi:predicted phage terminase large subunit-like protein
MSIDVDIAKQKILQLPPEKQAAALKILQELNARKRKQKAQTNFLDYVYHVWPSFIHGRHHEIMAEAFERVARGELKRLIINMPPRHTKSEFASYLLPSWYLGKYPSKKVIQTSHTAELATDFGRKVRNLVDNPDYKEIFPNVALQSDSKAAGRWNTSHGGTYFAIGVGGAVTGKGADLLIIDDPHSEQEAILAEVNPDIYDKVYEWYSSGPRQRLQPGGSIVIVMTRWSKRDLTAQVVKASVQRGGEEWEVIELPAIFDDEMWLEELDEDGEVVINEETNEPQMVLAPPRPLWPEFWSIEELLALKEELPVHKWAAQYMQNPTGAEGALIKKDWWQIWEKEDPPHCQYVIQSWDTAFSKSTRADYSACVTLGVFYRDDDIDNSGAAHIILLDAFKGRLEFPDLKARAFELYTQFQPDCCIIEAKAAGTPLIFELRSMGIPVQDYTPVRGNDKITRVNAVADLFASKMIWAPPTRWADEVVEEFASFPAGEHDDLVDAMTQALLRFRQGGLVRLNSDEPDEPRYFKRRGKSYY